MLLKIEKDILKKLSKQSSNQFNSTDFKKYKREDIFQALQSLKEQGYFCSIDADIDYSSFSYVLTTKGRFYKEYNRKQFISNFVVPFLVALLTTIATLYLEKVVENNKTTYNTENACEYNSDNP